MLFLLQSSDDIAGAAGCLGGVVGLVVGLVFYVFFCICAKKIVIKATKTDPGIVIWIPILQLIPMFNAAKINPLWIIGLIVPVLGIVVAIWLWWRLCEELGKPGWYSLLLLIPLVNIGLIVYLAFGD